MKRQGITSTGDEIPEAEIEAIWLRAEGPFAPLTPPRLTLLPSLSERLSLEHLNDPAVVETDHGQFALAI